MTQRRQLLLAGLAAWPAARADAPLLLRTPRHAGVRDTLGGYVSQLLALALERSPRRYELRENEESLPQGRALIEMLRPNPPVDVFWAVTTPERQAALLPIRAPIERGLIGWRVALVRKASEDRMREVRTLAQLSALQAGQKHDWPDVAILRANGLPVQTSTQYESLFGMLALGRVDYCPRSILEIRAELDAHASLGLAIEPHLVLHYPSALYFFVAPQRVELAQDIHQGLERAQSDGSFEKLFQAHFRDTIDTLRLAERRIFELRNPSLPADVPLQRPGWWYRPSRP